MNDKKQIKIDHRIINPCFDRKTQTDCPLRAVGCREKCNRYKIYKTLKEVEQRQKQKTIADVDLYMDIKRGKAKRLIKKTYKTYKGSDKK